MFPKVAGPRGLNFTFPLSAQTTYTVNFQLTDVGLDMINGVFIDNSVNAVGFTLFNPVSGQRVFIPAYSQGNVSLITSQNWDNLQFIGLTTGGVDVPCIFRNTEPQSDMIWSVIPPGTVTGSVTVVGQLQTYPIASIPTNRGSTIVTGGTSQLLAPANSQRRRIIIQNPYTPSGEGGIPTAEPLYFNFGAAATIDNGSFELYPGASYDSADGALTAGAINVIAATTGHRYIAMEF